MATCEMCGGQGPLKKTKIEGAKLDLCEDCQDLGEVVETAGTSTRTGTAGSTRKTGSTGSKTASKSSSRSQSSSRHEPDEELVEDFDTRVKQARESNGMGVKQLAGKIKEKDSVVHRVESGKLAPDQRLANKLEGALGITLYEQLTEVSATTPDDDTPGEQTIGDIAEVRERD